MVSEGFKGLDEVDRDHARRRCSSHLLRLSRGGSRHYVLGLLGRNHHVPDRDVTFAGWVVYRAGRQVSRVTWQGHRAGRTRRVDQWNRHVENGCKDAASWSGMARGRSCEVFFEGGRSVESLQYW